MTTAPHDRSRRGPATPPGGPEHQQESTDVATARSILSCPGEASLVVDGVDDVLAGIDPCSGLRLADLDGRPTFTCPADVPLARAARAGAHALLTLASGLGPAGGAERGDVLTLGGELASRGTEDCTCCAEVREVVVLDVGFVMLVGADRSPRRLDPDAFGDAAHRLNRGYLQRTVEHANLCHQDELRRAVAAAARLRVGDVAGVELVDLRPDHVSMRWVDPAGAHQDTVAFGRQAADADDLGRLLREALGSGLC